VNERTDPPPTYGTVGRYTIHDELASGGMATVHLGRLRGAAGFSRIVAIKRLRARLAQDRDFVAMFTDEARIASRIRHPSVVSTLDVVADGHELFLVMEYIHGETLAELLRTARARHRQVPPEILSAILLDALRGLHEAHEARDERGELLQVVHRDISPQNLLVGVDGVTRILDFGIAKAAGQLHTTASGTLKGKLAYMPPEQLLNEPLDRRADLYALGVVLWEALTGQRLFSSSDVSARLMPDEIQPPSALVDDLPPGLDRVVLRAVQTDRGRRHASAAEMARALEASLPPANPARVAAWVRELAQDRLDERAHLLARIETTADDGPGQVISTPALLAARVAPLPTTPYPTNPPPAPLPPTEPPPAATSDSAITPVAASGSATTPAATSDSAITPAAASSPTRVIPPPASLQPASAPPATSASPTAPLPSPAPLAPVAPTAPLPPSVVDSSGLSVAEIPPGPSPEPRRARTWLVALPTLLIAGGLLWWAAVPGEGSSLTPLPAALSAGVSVVSVVSAPVVSSSAEATAPAGASAAAGTGAAGGAAGAGTSVVGSAQKAPSARPPRPAAAAQPAGKTAEDCSPPYVLKDGIKHYKRNCFR
jgi:serine/threonine protein kinase